MALQWIVAIRAGIAIALVTVLAACGAGGSSPRTAATSVAGTSAPATVPTVSGPPANPSPSLVDAASPSLSPLPSAPPAATLSGLAGGRPATGALGTYTWGGGGSDAPWIVGKRAGTAGSGSRLAVDLGGLTPVGWDTAWAKVRNGVAASPTGASSGTGLPVVTAPSSGGDWTLRVTVSFGPGANATYYWRISVTP
jgi:hypothetical protein